MYTTSRTSLSFLRRTALYLRTDDGGLSLLKKSGETVSEAGLNLDDLPGRLFVRPEDKLLALKEIQQGLKHALNKRMDSGDLVGVKETMVELVEETLSQPRSGSLEGLNDVMGDLVRQYTDQPDVLHTLAHISSVDYTTAVHSVNVMALALSYGAFYKLTMPRMQSLGLSALLHDVGKTQVPIEILTSPRKLTDEQFNEMRAHSSHGYNIIRKCRFNDAGVALAALQHHERLDGSGYPKGTTDLSPTAMLLGIIDCFEAVTADERPYRDSMEPFKALTLIKGDVENGKMDKRLFEKFVKCLV